VAQPSRAFGWSGGSDGQQLADTGRLGLLLFCLYDHFDQIRVRSAGGVIASPDFN